MAGVTPKSLVLDLLRVTQPRALPVRAFVEVAALFGLTGNALRVAVTRLVSAGLVESDERGWYRLAPAAAPISRHVAAWRMGEERLRPWGGDWHAVSLGRGAARAVRERSRRALELVGYRQGLDGLWLRPDNLVDPPAAVAEKLEALGLEPGAHAFVARDFDAGLVDRWKRTLWPCEALSKSQREMRQRLERSASKLDKLELGAAAAETFVLGGAAIRMLSTDPLLPAEIAPACERAALTETMRRYDVLGRRVWAELTGSVKLDGAPVHLSVLEGAA